MVSSLLYPSGDGKKKKEKMQGSGQKRGSAYKKSEYKRKARGIKIRGWDRHQKTTVPTPRSGFTLGAASRITV